MAFKPAGYLRRSRPKGCRDAWRRHDSVGAIDRVHAALDVADPRCDAVAFADAAAIGPVGASSTVRLSHGVALSGWFVVRVGSRGRLRVARVDPDGGERPAVVDLECRHSLGAWPPRTKCPARRLP